MASRRVATSSDVPCRLSYLPSALLCPCAWPRLAQAWEFPCHGSARSVASLLSWLIQHVAPTRFPYIYWPNKDMDLLRKKSKSRLRCFPRFLSVSTPSVSFQQTGPYAVKFDHQLYSCSPHENAFALHGEYLETGLSMSF